MQAKKRAAFLKRHLGRTLDLNEFEQLLAAQVRGVSPGPWPKGPESRSRQLNNAARP